MSTIHDLVSDRRLQRLEISTLQEHRVESPSLLPHSPPHPPPPTSTPHQDPNSPHTEDGGEGVEGVQHLLRWLPRSVGGKSSQEAQKGAQCIPHSSFLRETLVLDVPEVGEEPEDNSRSERPRPFLAKYKPQRSVTEQEACEALCVLSASRM